MNQVGFTEKFAPLIGINLRTQSDITVKLNYNKSRTVMLTLSNIQVTEMKSNDIMLDIGFRKQKVKVPFSDIVLPNDLTFRCAFTLRDTRTMQRRIDDNERQESKPTAGNINIQFRPTLSYTVNQRVSLTGYFDRTINNPVVLNAFPRKTTAFGVQVLFSLAQ
jgi:cell surface protein SprA